MRSKTPGKSKEVIDDYFKVSESTHSGSERFEKKLSFNKEGNIEKSPISEAVMVKGKSTKSVPAKENKKKKKKEPSKKKRAECEKLKVDKKVAKKSNRYSFEYNVLFIFITVVMKHCDNLSYYFRISF